VEKLGVGQLSLRLPRPKKFPSLKASESQIETAICHYLQVKGYFFYKSPAAGYFKGTFAENYRGQKVMVGSFRKHLNPYVRRGVPDLIIVHHGKFIGLEVKSETGRVSEYQKQFQSEVIKAGGNYFVVRSVSEVQDVLGGI